MFSVQELRKSWQDRRSARLPKVSVMSLGIMLALVIPQKCTARNLDLLIVENLKDAPAAVHDILHLDVNPWGVSLREFDEFLSGVRLSGSVAWDDTFFYPVARQEELAKRKQYFQELYPEVMDWLCELKLE